MTRYFRTFNDAKTYCRNTGNKTKPVRVSVWFCYERTLVWAVK